MKFLTASAIVANPWRAAAGFAAFALWLPALPMKGFLLGEAAGTEALLLFLLPHVAAIGGAALWMPTPVFWKLRLWGVAATMVLTAAWPLLSSMADMSLLIPLLGLVSSSCLLQAGALLKSARQPGLAAALGLALGNAALFGLFNLPLPPQTLFVVIALALGALLQRAGRGDQPRPPARKKFFAYLPLILVFYLVNGLRYDLFQPQAVYEWLPPALDVLLYAASALAAWMLLRRDRDLTLALGILFGMVSLSFSLWETRPLFLLSKFSIQFSVGFVDFFVLALALAQPEAWRALGLTAAAMCLGIAGGEILVIALGAQKGVAEPVLVIGNLALTVAVLLLYTFGRRTSHPKEVGLPGAVAADSGGRDSAGQEGTLTASLPPGILDLFSPREWAVLEMVWQGKPYRVVADEMDISESSVKTYMRRVGEKLGVSGRQDILDRLARFSEEAGHSGS